VAGGFVLNDLGEVGFAVGTFVSAWPLMIDPVLVYSTYRGGSSDDLGFGIGVDAAGSAFVTGQANSANFPTTPGAFER
jgi:hypothetical protein